MHTYYPTYFGFFHFFSHSLTNSSFFLLFLFLEIFWFSFSFSLVICRSRNVSSHWQLYIPRILEKNKPKTLIQTPRMMVFARLFLINVLLIVTSALHDVEDAKNNKRDDSSNQDLMNKLQGTWTSKSHQVFTGPGFYDPVDELIIEPSLPGLSYSFTSDGYYEEAIYKVISNPKNPECPSASIIYQHGTYSFAANNNSLMLYPFEADGRQLYSDPCNDKGISTFTRFINYEVFKWFLIEFDDYRGVMRLNLHQFDGSPIQPLYLAYDPPVMLPTETMNPTAAADSTASATSSSKKSKRDIMGLDMRSRLKRQLENKYKTNAQLVKRSPGKTLFGVSEYKLMLWGSGALCFLGSVLFLRQ